MLSFLENSSFLQSLYFSIPPIFLTVEIFILLVIFFSVFKKKSFSPIILFVVIVLIFSATTVGIFLSESPKNSRFPLVFGEEQAQPDSWDTSIDVGEQMAAKAVISSASSVIKGSDKSPLPFNKDVSKNAKTAVKSLVVSVDAKNDGDLDMGDYVITNKLTVDDGGLYTKKGNVLHIKNEVEEISGTIADNSHALLVEQLNSAGMGSTMIINSDAMVASALRINADTETVDAISVYADALTTGSAALFSSDSTDPSSRSLVDIVNDNVLATGATALRVQQDSTGSIASFFDGNTQVFSILDGGNIGIRTTSQFGSGSGVLAFGDAAVNPTTTLTNAALLYASGGELYAYDAAGNATQISPHDQSGLWYYYSENIKTGKTLEISMEALIKDIDQILGGGYVFENGERLFSGENKIASLTLETNKNTATLDGLEYSMEGVLSTKNAIDGVSDSLDDITGTLSSQRREVDALKERVTISEGIQKEQGILLGTLQEQMILVKEQNQSVTDFLLAVNPETLLYKDMGGNLRLPDGQIEAGGVIAETFTVQAQSGTKSPTIGQATILTGEKKIVIETAGVTSGSKVFVSFTNDLKGRNYFVAEKKKGQSFTVELSSPAVDNVSFDWWIVNENR